MLSQNSSFLKFYKHTKIQRRMLCELQRLVLLPWLPFCMAALLPPEMVIRVLNPIIKTGDFPVNQAAIKMLTKVVEKQTTDSMEIHVAEVMPGLLKAYDNVESSVRKASVFCIVAIHQLVGEANLQPHLECLNGSKMKLLSLYIKRAQAQSNAGSPRLTPS